MTNDEIRSILRTHEAVLVHFNTPMSRHERGYPHDLKDAILNPQWGMSYSTVQAGDLGPSAMGHHSRKQCGSVGLLVDVADGSEVDRTCFTDGGSNGRDYGAGFGEKPSTESCSHSITNRPDGHNEWFMTFPKILGIFTFVNPDIFRPGDGCKTYPIGSVPGDFPDLRVIALSGKQFYEYDRLSAQWLPISYADIYPAT